MDKSEAIEMINEFAIQTFGMQAGDAVGEDCGCYIFGENGKKWMSPKNAVENLFSLIASQCSDVIDISDLPKDEEEEDNE